MNFSDKSKDQLLSELEALRARLAEVESTRAEKDKESLAEFARHNPNPLLRVAEDGTILYANKPSTPLLDAWDCQTGQVLSDPIRQLVSDAFRSNACREIEIQCQDRTFLLMISPDIKGDYINLYGRDITKRKQREEVLEFYRNVLTVANRHSEMTPLLKELVAEVKKFTGRTAVRIRVLDQEGNIRYEAYEGLSQQFSELENRFLTKVCINIIKGETEPNLPFYTPAGSFYMNQTTRFLATVSEGEKGETRNKCRYESIALVPIRMGDRVIGVIHVADSEENKVPFDMVNVLEEAAIQIGLVIERMRAQEELRESKERFEDLFQNAPVGYHEIDAQGRITRVNRTETALLGYTPEEMLGRPVFDFIAEQDKAISREAVQKRITQEQPLRTFERTYIKKDGKEIQVSISDQLILDSKGKAIGIRSILRDITEYKRLQAQLRQAQKMEAVGRLAGGVAHDFNNLLMVINGYSEFILGSLDPEDDLRKDVEEIKKAGERAAALTQQLLAFSRKQATQPEILDLNTVVTDVDKMLRRLIGEDIELLTITDPNLGSVKADRTQIEQVIMNLAANARDAMPEGGKLIIETANADLDEDYARRHISSQTGPYVMLAVTDTGVGMDPETRSHIFEPFFTTKEKGKGAGLGLATTYSIIKQSGGYIWIYSEPGQGTTVKIYLPRIEETPEAAQPEVPSESLAGTETILLVEDEESVRALLRNALENAGYNVLDAFSAEDAMRIYREHTGPIHLMMTDVVLPGMRGPELAEQLITACPEIKVIYMSGYPENAWTHNGVLPSGIIFLQKPFDPKTALRKIRSTLDHPRANHSGVSET